MPPIGVFRIDHARNAIMPKKPNPGFPVEGHIYVYIHISDERYTPEVQMKTI